MLPPVNVRENALGATIAALREKAGLNRYQLHKTTGLSQSQLRELEDGTNQNPSLQTLQKLAQALGVPVSQLLGEAPPPGDTLDLDGDIDQAVDELVKQTDSDRDAVLKQLIIDALRARGHDVGPTRFGRPVKIVEWPVENVPVVGLAAAGANRFPEWAHEDEDGADLPVLIAERARTKGWKLVRVRGDSMSPTYEDGDLVFVLPQKDVERLEDTDVVVFWNGESQVKRFRVDNRNRWVLVPDNPIYPPIVPPAFERLHEYGWFLAGVVTELAKRRR